MCGFDPGTASIVPQEDHSQKKRMFNPKRYSINFLPTGESNGKSIRYAWKYRHEMKIKS